MIRPPPRSTLFPYTPLSRSQYHRKGSPRATALCPPRRSDLCRPPAAALASPRDQRCPQVGSVKSRLPLANRRSEEHTSELQSRLHLVCRLLLEKKTYRPSMF